MLTAHEIYKEYSKCLMNPIYAIETYLETFDKTQEGFVPFKLFPRQKQIIEAYEKNRFNIVTKPRQAGVSTTTAAYMSIKVALADEDNPEAILIIANKQELAFEFLGKIKDFLSQLPRWVWGAEYYGSPKNDSKTIFLTDSKKEIKLPNGSRVKAVATSKDALRGFTPTFLIMDEAAYIDNGAEVFGAALTALGTGGRATLISCVTKDTFVYTEKGIKQVSDFIDETKNITEPYIIKPLSIMGKDRIRRTNIMVNNGIQKTIKLTSKSSNLECSETHLIWGFSNKLKKYGWLNSKYLEVGDYINIQSGFNIWGDNDKINHEYIFSNKERKPEIIYDTITKDLSYLIGMYIAEGSTYKKYNDKNELIGINITLTCGDDLSKIITNCGFKYSCWDGLHYTISSKYLGSLLEYLGVSLEDKAKNKKIPNRLLEMSKDNIISLVQGIMDGDGYSDTNRLRIGFNSSSFVLVEQLRVILNNFGIRTDYQTGVTPITKIANVESVYHRISATSIDAIKYYDIIGFRFDRKQLKKQELKENFRLTQSEFIPNGKVILRNIIDDFKLTRKLSNTGLLVNKLRVTSKNKTNDLNKQTFESFYNYFINELNLDLTNYGVDKILINNGKWEKINKIEYSEAEVYDFSLPNIIDDEWSHSIVYNGILGHQTPNGMDPLYYKTYDQAKHKKNNFNIIEMKWYEDLRYNKDLRWVKGDLVEKEIYFTFESYNSRISDGWKPTSSWYEEMCMGMNNDARMIAQELDVSFIGSGGNVISEEYIEFHEKNNVREPKVIMGLENEIWIWEEPKEGHQYIMGCLPPDEKVLTNNGLKNIQDVDLTDMLVSENGDYVGIINKQIYPVINEDIFEITVDNTFRKTTFTKEHPLLVSKPILKRNYNKKNEFYLFNERYWDFNFNYTRTEEVEIGDWVKVPNIYKKEINRILDDKWVISKDIRYDFNIDSPLKDKDFWWFIGMWLGDGWLGKLNNSYSLSICFDAKDEYYLNKTNELIIRLFDRSPSFIDKGNNSFELVFNSKFLYYFMLENFGQYSYGKKISEWVKFIPNEFKIELIKGYLASDGCWLKTEKNSKINSKITFVSINLELLESIQDIIFSLGVISSLNKLRNAKKSYISGKLVNQKEAYNLCLANNDSLELIKLLNNDILDPKLNSFNLDEFKIINRRTIKSCHFNEDKDFIYFRIKNINKYKFTGNVYNFECDTHTFMCHHITTHNCDVSRGDGEDSSTIVIIDFTTMEQVMEYQGKIQPDLLAQIVEEYGDLYEAYTVVDVTGGMGVSTVLKLLEFNYKRLHYDDSTGKILSARQRELNSHLKKDKIPGFHATNVRVPMISNLEYKIRTNAIKIRSSRMTSEMKTFIYKNGRPDHMDGYHDDLLMSLAMCLWVMEHSFKKLERLEKQNKAILNSWIGNTNKSPVLTEKDRETGITKKIINTNHTAYRNVQDPRGQYSWLFAKPR
jgi:hypothetical protein